MAKGFDLGNIGGLLEQAKAMQERLASVQAEAATRTVEATAGGGMVRARMNGKLELLALTIDPEVLASGDRDMLQDLVVAAVNLAIRQAQAAMAEEMSKVTGGLKIPGLL